MDLSENELKREIKGLQEKSGRLNYIRTHSRPDIEFAVGKIARYVLYSHKKVIIAVNKIIRYVYQTKDRPFIFRKEKEQSKLMVFTASSHVMEYDLLSRHGYLVFYEEIKPGTAQGNLRLHVLLFLPQGNLMQ